MWLELEVDERLHFGRNELIGHKDRCYGGQDNQRQRHAGKPDAVSAFPVCGKPMHNHSEKEKEEDVAIGRTDGKDVHIPSCSDGFDHLRGYAPGCLVGDGGVEV